MKKYLEYIILGAVALLSILYIGLRESSEINYTLPSFRMISRDDFTRLEISGPTVESAGSSETINIDKTSGGWMLTEGSYPADSGKINKLLDAVEEVVPMDLVSQSENYGRYDLDDENRITLKAWNGDRLVREIYYGKLSASRKYNYVLFPGDKNVYTLRGNMRDTLTTSEEDFRSKVVLQLNRNDVIKITFKGEGTARTLTRGTEGNWTDDTGTEWTSQTMNEILGNITNLKCQNFIGTAPSGSGYEFTVSTGTEEYRLELFEKIDAGYPGTSSYHDHPFIITSYTGDALTGAFLPEEEEENG